MITVPEGAKTTLQHRMSSSRKALFIFYFAAMIEYVLAYTHQKSGFGSRRLDRSIDRIGSPYMKDSTFFPRRALWNRLLLPFALTTTCSTKLLDPQSAWAAAPSRVEGIGGGFDVRQPPLSAIKIPDVIYPASMEGLWSCERRIISVEGNSEQAREAWTALGGSKPKLFGPDQFEEYLTRFFIPPFNHPQTYTYNDSEAAGVARDRGFEILSRASSSRSVQWEVAHPNLLRYSQDGTNQQNRYVELLVVQRKSEIPTSSGFGFDELIRITSAAGGFIPGGIEKVARVQRKYRRALNNATGARIVEGIELVKTFRVLDGVAGIEMPTSTTKSMLRMSRPNTA